MPDRKCFYGSVKDGTTGDNGEKLDGHISNKDYLACNKIWNEFSMKNMGDYHNDYLKKDVLLWAIKKLVYGQMERDIKLHHK